jgi:hypothetical protein
MGRPRPSAESPVLAAALSPALCECESPKIYIGIADASDYHLQCVMKSAPERRMVSIRLLVFTLLFGLCVGTLQAIAWEAGEAVEIYSSGR